VIPAQKIIETMTAKLYGARNELDENGEYFESGFRPQAIGLSVPPAMKHLLAKVGWPRVYLGAIEERLDIEGFRLAKQAESDDKLWSWWQYNALDVESSLAHMEALIHGRAYVTISAPDPDDKLADPTIPVIRVESPKHMYAHIDPRTRRVTQAIRVYDDPETGAQAVTLYLPDVTLGIKKGSGGWEQAFPPIQHNLGVVPVVPIVNRDRVDQLYGYSQITPELRSVTDAAARLTMDLQAAAELMALPQRILFGIDEDTLKAQTSGGNTWDAYMARILAFGDSEGHIQQFAAAELRNYADGMEVLTKQAASYTGLPAAYFSFSSDNPASADAIRASEVRLVKKAERKQRMFGEAWEQVMRIAMLVMKEKLPKDSHRLETVWRDASTPTYSAMADAVMKLATGITADGRPVIPVEQARIDLRYTDIQRKQMDIWDQNSPRARLADLYGSAPGAPGPKDPEAPDNTAPPVPNENE
jgi:SPP1 Gp6-like portal protein